MMWLSILCDKATIKHFTTGCLILTIYMTMVIKNKTSYRITLSSIDCSYIRTKLKKVVKMFLLPIIQHLSTPFHKKSMTSYIDCWYCHWKNKCTSPKICTDKKLLVQYSALNLIIIKIFGVREKFFLTFYSICILFQ